MKTRSAKNKGIRLQKYVAQRISEITKIPCGKDLDIESRQMGQSGIDIILHGKAKKLFPFSIECKYQETWSVPAWIQQAKDNWKKGTDWLLFLRKNRHEEIVVLDAEAFFKIYKEYLKLKKGKTCAVKKRRN